MSYVTKITTLKIVFDDDDVDIEKGRQQTIKLHATTATMLKFIENDTKVHQWIVKFPKKEVERISYYRGEEVIKLM